MHVQINVYAYPEMSASTESNGSIILLLRSGLSISPQDVRKPTIATEPTHTHTCTCTYIYTTQKTKLHTIMYK